MVKRDTFCVEFSARKEEIKMEIWKCTAYGRAPPGCLLLLYSRRMFTFVCKRAIYCNVELIRNASHVLDAQTQRPGLVTSLYAFGWNKRSYGLDDGVRGNNIINKICIFTYARAR